MFPNGEKYVGEMKNNLPHGGGVKTYANGDKYTGEFKKGFESGFGEKSTELWTYEGSWELGL